LILRLIERVSGASGVIAGWLIVPLIFATVYEVVSRYVFTAPTIWAYEVGYLATGTSFLIGMAYALREGAHIRIDVISMHMSAKLRAGVDLVLYGVFLIPFVAWLSHLLYTRALDAYHSGERSGQSAWNPPVWPFRTIFFIAFALLLIQIVGEMIKCVRVLAGHDKSPAQGSGAR
jgi:TRAP-type mannitol/chloroaromatic compound transport system, small permease component